MSSCRFFFQAEDGIRDLTVTGVQTCALPIYRQVARAGLLQAVPVDPEQAVTRQLLEGKCRIEKQHGRERSPREGGRAVEIDDRRRGVVRRRWRLVQILLDHLHHVLREPEHAVADVKQRVLVRGRRRSEEHTSELQSQSNLVCRLLLEKKKKATQCWIR